MTNKNQKLTKKPLDTALLIAIIGLLGAILPAIITAVFGHLSTKAQIEMPISATQTAELKLTVSTPPPSVSQTPTGASNVDWQDYLEIENSIRCNDIVVIPQDLDFSSGTISEKIAQAISQGNIDQSIYQWNKIPEVNIDFRNVQRAAATIDINNVASDDNWIELSKSLTVSITAGKEIPGKINAVRIGGGCGGGGDIREFPPLDLATDFEQYTDKTVFPEFDFFKLEKGEFERFKIPFTCRAPGYYKLTIDIPYVVRNKTSKIQTTANVICPKEISLWFFDSMENKIIGAGESYSWNGNSYINNLTSNASGNNLPATPTLTPETAQDVTSDSLTLGSLEETEYAINNDVKSLTSLAKGGSFSYNGTTRYDVSVTNPEEKLLWLSNGWCAIDEAILVNNLESIRFDFFINDEPINIEKMTPRIFRNENDYLCGGYAIVAHNWPNSATVLTSRISIIAAINDGVNDYKAGDQLTWHIVVNGLK